MSNTLSDTLNIWRLIMNKNKKSRFLLVTTVVVLVTFLLSPFMGKVIPAKPSSVSAAEFPFKAYLPIEMQKYPLQTVFGAGMDQITSDQGLDQMVAAKTSWTRTTGVVWSLIEPVQGTYNWSILSGLESELKNASSKGLQVVLLVHSTPEWARKLAGSGPTCGPIAAGKLAAFGDFMHALVERYSKAPYNVKYWEMWNEEDVDPSVVPANNPYGCWGNQNDDYYGGGYYAEMLKAVYPQIKDADREAQVMIGGLLMDCDSRGGCAAMGKSKLPAMFLEGILRNNGGPYFDGVSYHAYDYYLGELGKYYNPNWTSAWNTTGPVGIPKAQYIQGLLNQYGVTGKFLMNTESALVCGKYGSEPICRADDFAKTKGSYLTETFAAAVAQGLRANIWYSALGWRASGLLDWALRPLPAYTAYQFARNEINDVSFIGEITQFPGVKGYWFAHGNRHVWVVWSLDGSTHKINLSDKPDNAWDNLGNPVATANSMNINVIPSYLEWTP